MSAALDEPREAFWSRYNRRSELPLSAATAVFVHTFAAALLVLTIGWFMHSPAKAPVVVQFVPDLGLDDEGAGAPGTDEAANDLRPGEPHRALEPALVPPIDLPAPKEAQPNPNLAEGPQPVPMPKADFGAFDGAVQGKQPGSKKGDGRPGAGTGGTGAESSRARMQRWVLRFRTVDGQDYVNQLAAMNAELLVPVSPDETSLLHVPDLKDPAKRGPAAAEDLKRLAGMVRFSDLREDSVRGVCEALKLDAKARSFHAFFPKKIEERLAKKETGFRNRLPENIAQTVFEIRIRDGEVEIAVVDQVVKQ